MAATQKKKEHMLGLITLAFACPLLSFFLWIEDTGVFKESVWKNWIIIVAPGLILYVAYYLSVGAWSIWVSLGGGYQENGKKNDQVDSATNIKDQDH